MKLKNEIGNKYNKLTVLRRADGRKSDTRAWWRCKCDCGNETEVDGKSLRNSNTKSCGCLRKLPKGQSAFNAMVLQVKRGAKRRGYKWELSEEQVKELNNRPCFYCGEKYSNNMSHPTWNGNYIYNGIDRVDNNKGYGIDNVVPCCSDCNIGKGKKTMAEFLEWIDRVVDYNKKEVSHA